jgi:hypothetical protein
MRAVRALERAGFQILRQVKHIVMAKGDPRVAIPRANPVDAVTMAVIVEGAGLTESDFRKLL